ncbi:MAG TPA: CDP-alcohol phosphatidyltransferase family protein [Saprospiraceae bacterium]|nr:CDP-alcohol phosphatidyltransferase family protein [Saprospiraceae bacterium]
MKHLPNLITAGNLLLGCLAAVRFWEGNYRLALIFFILALLMDWLDGFTAHLLQAHSEIGKQLDSLADMVTFGFLPGLLWYTLFVRAGLPLWAGFGFVYTVAAAFRLAKFNVDQTQRTDFSGLPSPAAAMFSLGYFYWWQQDVAGFRQILEQPICLFLFLVLASGFMVVNLPMFSLKIKRWTWEGNAIKFIFALAAIPVLLIWKIAALLPLIGMYILISLLKWLFWNKINS